VTNVAHPKPVFAVLPENQLASRLSSEHCSRVQPDYVAVFNDRRKFVEVSPSFCKLLGYAENELIGRPFEDVTVPRTNNIPILVQMLIENGYLQGIWVLAHKRGTKLFVRFATVLRTDGLYEAAMELIAAGA
jgi:PAS domain S-box-containing protein